MFLAMELPIAVSTACLDVCFDECFDEADGKWVVLVVLPLCHLCLGCGDFELLAPCLTVVLAFKADTEA